jgi:hypothetical protein
VWGVDPFVSQDREAQGSLVCFGHNRTRGGAERQRRPAPHSRDPAEPRGAALALSPAGRIYAISTGGGTYVLRT